MFKMVDVVMLATNQKAKVGEYLVLNKENKLCFWNTNTMGVQNTLPIQHLYFLSDEEIKNPTRDQLKVGLLFHSYNDSIHEGFITNNLVKTIGTYREIIATTDGSLTIPALGHEFTGWTNYLPQPSQSFLKVLVKESHKGNHIKKVMVEYEDKIALDGHTIIGNELKINPKDNTITIRKVNEKGEHIRAFVKQLQREFADQNLEYLDFAADRFIEQNL